MIHHDHLLFGCREAEEPVTHNLVSTWTNFTQIFIRRWNPTIKSILISGHKLLCLYECVHKSTFTSALIDTCIKGRQTMGLVWNSFNTCANIPLLYYSVKSWLWFLILFTSASYCVNALNIQTCMLSQTVHRNLMSAFKLLFLILLTTDSKAAELVCVCVCKIYLMLQIV